MDSDDCFKAESKVSAWTNWQDAQSQLQFLANTTSLHPTTSPVIPQSLFPKIIYSILVLQKISGLFLLTSKTSYFDSSSPTGT